MSATDAAFYLAESDNTPMHVGSVAVFEGPAPSYGDVVRLLLGKLAKVPRYRQRVREVPMHLGRPLWVDDTHFQILYHIRHSAVPRPGGPEQLRNLAGRVLGQRLDVSKPLWELWLVEGLENGRWAIINKVHHAMVDGVAGTDLMQLIFDVDPQAPHPEPVPWLARRSLSTGSVVARSVGDAVAQPARQLARLTLNPTALPSPQNLLRRGVALGNALAVAGRQFATPAASSMNGPVGPHRRWAWADTTVADVKRVREAFGGTMNDVVLTAITAGFRDQLEARGELRPGLVVRTLVPVSIRREAERGSLNNQVSSVFVDLPVTERRPKARLESIRRQMDGHKRLLAAVDPRVAVSAGDLVPPGLLAFSTRLLMRTSQPWMQAVTTNVPGPRVPLYMLGRKMESLYPYVPIGAGMRTSIGIFSYTGTITFGVNVDFDAVPDVNLLTGGICRGMAELLELADAELLERAPVPGSEAARSPAVKRATRKRTAADRAAGSARDARRPGERPVRAVPAGRSE